ncbi:T9SS type B sorting domain-containing protein [Taibaiella lutea]|uniref:T9SS type B sorting domain-containing protein n=1 Tax=Taibaiella lutea TaxID=2608001 RepID=A0A5M6CF07_9BACT|nr:gliding motility-associated C-terminal domain-containing protein [Taibaiella lutea]KAA5533563.1 T9SS type B sorting domain-containing protein [Taibaiella lutea]
MKLILKTILLLLLFASVASGSPIQFIPNKDQWNAPFAFKATIRSGYTVFFEKNAMTFLLSDYSQVEDRHHKQPAVITPASLWKDETGENETSAHNAGMVNNHAYRITFLNAVTTEITGENASPYYHNYFLGNDRNRWKGHVNVFGGLRYRQIYPGIDLSYQSNKDNNVKYEFIVAPHASPESIQMRYTGADLSIAGNGNLVIKTSLGDVVEHAPYSFQIIGGEKVTVPSHFEIDNGVVSFAFSQGYDQARELVIDPIVEYQTFSGATDEVNAQGSSYGPNGNMYALVTAFNNQWPATLGAFQTAFAGDMDIAMNVYTPDGSGLMYSSYVGGAGAEEPTSVSVNKLGQAVIVGYTSSSDFPTTAGCLQTLQRGNDGVAAVLSNDGAMLLSGSYYGSKSGDDLIQDVVWANDNEFYIYGKCGGNTPPPNKLPFAMPANAFKPNNTGRYGSFVLKLNREQTQLLAGTYIGHSPSGKYEPLVLRLNEYTGEILIGGWSTNNANYPTTANAFQQPNTTYERYGTISKFDADLTTLEASSCLHTVVSGLDVDPDGNIYALGQTGANDLVTPSPGVYSENDPVWSFTFLAKMNSDLSAALVQTNLPPNLISDRYAFERSNCGHFYMYYTCTDPNVGTSPPYGVPFTPNTLAGGATNNTNGYYLMELNKDFQLVFASWLGFGTLPGGGQTSHWHGGTQDIDPEGRLYVNQCFRAGMGTAGAWSPSSQNGGAWDAASTVVDMEMLRDTLEISLAALPDSFLCIGDAFQFNGTLSDPADFTLSFGDGSPNETLNLNPAYTYAAPGVYNVILEATPVDGCDFSTVRDSITVSVLEPEVVTVYPQDTVACNAGPVEVTVQGGATYAWMPAALVDNPTASMVRVTNNGETNLTVNITDSHKCKHTKSVHIGKYSVFAEAGPDQIIILGKKESAMLDGSESIGADIHWDANPTLNSTTSLTPVATPKKTTWYYINAEDHTCISRDSAKVTIAHFGAPNAFSPNGDGLNDVFNLNTNDERFFIIAFSIYNRYGEKVFNTIKNEGWNGTFNGRPCDGGVYYYYATVTIEDVRYELKGDITLIR